MMGYEYWGHTSICGDGRWTLTKIGDNKPEPIDPCQLPEEFKTKIAMLDLMNYFDNLPCGSNKIYFSRLKLLVYFLFIEVSSAREEGNDGV